MSSIQKWTAVRILTVLVFTIQSAYSQSDYRFQHFNTKDGLANDFVMSLEQDSLGYIWFQYYGGLTRYDGYTFKEYKFDRGDPLRSALDFLVGHLVVNRKGKIYATKHHPDEGSLFTIAKHNPRTDGFEKQTADVDGSSVNCSRFDKNSPILWLGAWNGKGLYAFNTESSEIKTYLNNTADSNINSNRWTSEHRNSITGIADKGEFLLLATLHGLWRFDKATKTFSRPKCKPQDSILLYHYPMNDIIDAPNGDMWLNVKGGLTKVDRDLAVVQQFDFPTEFPGFEIAGYKLLNFQGIALDDEGIFWIATPGSGGLFRFDTKDGTLLNLKHVPDDPYSLRSNDVYGVMVDRDQNVWVGTGKGASKLQRSGLKFHNIALGEGLSAKTIYKTKGKDFVLIGKRNKSGEDDILLTPITGGQISPHRFQETLTPIKGNQISQIFQGKNNLWVSSVYGGVVRFPINPKTGMMAAGSSQVFRNSPSNQYTIVTDNVQSIWEDKDETLWVGAGGGLSRVIPSISYGAKGSVFTYKHVDADTNSIAGNQIWKIYPEDEDSFWILSDHGADLFHPDSETFEHVYSKGEFPVTLHKSKDGTTFLGTLGGLYQAKKERGHYRFETTPLWNKTEVMAIQEDRLGRLWLSSSTGPVCYDREEKIAIQFNESDGVNYGRTIQPDYLQQTSDGIMLISNLNGISLFDPATLTIDRKKIRPVLTKLEVNNKAIIGSWQIGENDLLMDADISMTGNLVIDHKHNNFSLEFSALEITAPEKNLYQHKLDGFDKFWIETDWRTRTATYTNLSAGDYTFRVKASNHHSVWSDLERTLLITVLPPPWRTWWAYTGYSLLAAGLLLLARRNLVQRERLKSNLKLEHLELEKAKEVDRVKTSFFTNISHEFRTPLTLIKGPVQNILDRYKDDPKLQDQLKFVQRNSDLLLRLINQLLDLAKLESGSLKVEKTEADLFSFIRAVASSFESFARQKGVTLSVEVPSSSQSALFDKDKLETILINLINNAIKFTPSGGIVSVQAQIQSHAKTPAYAEAATAGKQSGQGLTVVVKDSGIGIPVDQLSKIFERFHQVSESHKEVGTGIGLSLVKELVALMEGEISVKSESGKGSEFTVILPLEILEADHHVAESTTHGVRGQQPVIGISNIEHPDSAGRSVGAGPISNDEVDSSKPQVLVVEDNSDLRAFIIDSLGVEFNFLQAENGRQGLDLATSQIPDLIISDVMMPEMDGITMLGKIKKDIRTSHIPLILLTAKSSEDSKLSGLESGADDYLTKPFNKNELLLKVRNRIEAQKKIREKVKFELLSEGPKLEVQSADEQFLQKVKESILSRLSDEQLSVESLADEIGLSRSQLFRKIVALTGVSANELIRKFRLQKAAQLLQQNWGPVSQVAYEVGFSNLSYFSKVFKEEFGVLPSEYEKGVIG